MESDYQSTQCLQAKVVASDALLEGAALDAETDTVSDTPLEGTALDVGTDTVSDAATETENAPSERTSAMVRLQSTKYHCTVHN
jgi:hypothetical protein